MKRLVPAAILTMSVGVVAGSAMSAASSHGPVKASQESAVGRDLVVTTSWLADHLDDPAVVVIGTGSADDFADGHIAGAAFVGHGATMGGSHGPPEPAATARLLAAAGARDDAHIVIYGGSAMEVGWFYMLFASIGHGDHVSILSGNLRAWRTEGRPVTASAASPSAGTLTVRSAPDVIVDASWVRERLEDSTYRLLDVRTERERADGYVPGSTLVLWQDLFVEPDVMRFKSRDAIRVLLVSAGVTSDRQGVAYCAIGMRASLMYFAMRHAGVPGRVYLGSWDDWRRQPGYPIGRGGGDR